MSAQPDQRLNRDDGADPDKSPFGSADVFLVEFGSEKISEENRPDNSEGPDVCAEVKGQRVEQLRVLNLRIFDQGRHRELRGRPLARNPGGQQRDASISDGVCKRILCLRRG